MIKKEYKTVKELSKKFKITARNIRKIAGKLTGTTNKELLHKDANGQWMINHVIENKFKPTRKLLQKYYALTIDPPSSFTEKEIHEIMNFVLSRMEGPNVEINYTVQRKKANGKRHIHCFINCNQRRKLIENLRLGFSNIGYKETDIYDLAGWKDYITREGEKITKIKK